MKTPVRASERMAALLFLGTGTIALVTLPLPAPANLSRSGTLVVALAAMACGIVTAILPWERWTPRASLVLVPIALGLIAAGNAVGGSSFLTYGIFFVVVYVWIGMTQPRWTSVLTAPLAAVAYLLPLLRLPIDRGVAVASTILTVAMCVLVGETLAWGRRRMVVAEARFHEEREASERLHALQRAQEVWLSAASHELRTPITICRGYLDVMSPSASVDEVGRTVGVVVDELERMDRLVEDVASLARLRERAFVRTREAEVGPFLAEVATKAQPLLAGRLHIDPVPDGSIVRADTDRLTQALLNLVQNAGTHADGGIELRARRDRRTWRFEVQDHGPGLPAGTEEVVFQPFWRGGSDVPGRGLGLAVVQAIAEAHRGEAGVDNDPGEGATFWITVPA